MKGGRIRTSRAGSADAPGSATPAPSGAPRGSATPPGSATPAGSASQAGSGSAQGSVAGIRTSSGWPAGWLVVIIPALAELIVGGYKIGVPSLWRDEAATISGSQRSLSAILTMVGHQDAVHAPYYVLMHPVIAVGGTSATVLRLPSLIAMTIAAGLTGALGRRLARASRLPGPAIVGLLAGLALAAIPLTTRYAQDARPYALTTLFVVCASYTFLRALESPRSRWWVAYAASLLLAGLFNLFAVLLVVAHGVSLIWLARVTVAASGEDGQSAGVSSTPVSPAGASSTALSPAGVSPVVVSAAIVRRWIAACAAAIVLLSPVIVLSAAQSSQLNWVTRPGLGTLAALVRDFSGAAALIPVVAVIALLGCVAGLGPGSGRNRPALTAVALPWLVLPPLLLIVVSFIHPYYVERYVLYCLPAQAILVAAGLVWLVALTRRALAGRGLGPRVADLLAAAPSVVLALLIVGLVAGPQREVRQVSSRPDDLKAVAAAIAGRQRPGDAVLYLPRDADAVEQAYPAAFRHLRDIGLRASPLASGTLRGTGASPRVVAGRLGHVRRLWTVQWVHPLSKSSVAPPQMIRILAGLHLIRQWRIQSVVLRLYATSSR
jgi:mannosyltransferase